MSANHFFALPVEAAIFATPFAREAGCDRSNPEASKAVNGMPAAGTRRDSTPPGVPGEAHVPAAAYQLVGQGEGGVDMPGGASAGKNGQHGLTSCNWNG